MARLGRRNSRDEYSSVNSKVVCPVSQQSRNSYRYPSLGSLPVTRDNTNNPNTIKDYKEVEEQAQSREHDQRRERYALALVVQKLNSPNERNPSDNIKPT